MGESPSGQRETLIQNDQVDYIVATYSITDARKKKVDFAGPYLDTGQSLLVRSGETDITGPADLANGKRLCSVSGSTPRNGSRTIPGRTAAAVRHLFGVRRGPEERRHRRGQHRRGDPCRLRGPSPGRSRSSASRSRSSTMESASARTTSFAKRSTDEAILKMERTGAWKPPSTETSAPRVTAPPPPPLTPMKPRAITRTSRSSAPTAARSSGRSGPPSSSRCTRRSAH